MMDTDMIIEKVKTVLRDFPEVAGAYLFGSILGHCRPDSDIDLGLVLEGGLTPDSPEGDRLESALAILLPPFRGHRFDITILRPDKPLFAFKVIREGKLVYSRNPDRIADVVEIVSRRYAELYPRYRQALEEIFAEVIAGGR